MIELTFELEKLLYHELAAIETSLLRLANSKECDDVGLSGDLTYYARRTQNISRIIEREVDKQTKEMDAHATQEEAKDKQARAI